MEPDLFQIRIDAQCPMEAAERQGLLAQGELAAAKNHGGRIMIAIKSQRSCRVARCMTKRVQGKTNFGSQVPCFGQAAVTKHEITRQI